MSGPKRQRSSRAASPPDPATVESATPKRRGRPPGSPSLTKEREDTIVALIRLGATQAPAAKAAGVSPRTLRDWLAKGEGRSGSRPPSAKLRRFAARYRQAEGDARVMAERKVHTDFPRQWLTRTARATEDDEGWSDAPSRPGAPGMVRAEIGSMSDDELNQALVRLLEVAAALVKEASP